MRKTLLPAGVIFGLMMLFVGTAAANHSWGNYHWYRTSNPVVLQVGDNVNSTWDSRLNAAISDWNASSVLDLRKATGQARKNCKATAGRIEVCNGTYGNNGWLGIAQIWASGDHITQAITKVNDTYFNTSKYNTSAWRQLVMCQEIGHDFGLGHQDENFSNANLGTCMDYTSDPSSNQHPNTHDYDQLELIYGHLDGTASSGSDSGGGNCPPKNPKCSGSGVGNAPPFSQASRANGSVYVDHLPGRVTRVTHVFWTPFGD